MAIEIPNYRILEKLGEGAESKLYRARCMRTGRDYTVKIVKVAKPEDAGFVELLKAEHAIGTAVDHPVIRKVFELRLMRQRLRLRGAILFMEYVHGIPMSAKEFKAPLVEVLRLFEQVAEGLHAMHLAGFVHADLKPNNIMVTPEHHVKLIDLGQSAPIHQAKARIQGTIDYIAPEQVSRGVLDQRTDVFGLGAALHRVVTGKPVLTEMNQTVGPHSENLIGKRVEEIREPALESLPASLARLINDCCQTEPARRISDMPTLIERMRLARSVLEKQSTEKGDQHQLDEAFLAEEHDSVDDTLSETLMADLDLGDGSDDSFDLDDLSTLG